MKYANFIMFVISAFTCANNIEKMHLEVGVFWGFVAQYYLIKSFLSKDLK